MTKGPFPYTKILPTEYDRTLHALNIKTYSSLFELQNSNDYVVLFDISGRKIGSILNRQLIISNKSRPTSGVLLYTLTNKNGYIQCGKVVVH